MAKSEKQKQKLFRLLEILMRETDEESGLTVNNIINRLAEYGIKAERKSIYDDFLVLEELGYPVIKLATRPPQYTLESRFLELAELKMLVDAVQVSKFITAKKSREIIGKLEQLAGSKGARELSRQVYVEDRIKTGNAATIYSIDTIHKAINEGKRLSFKYFDYDREKKRVYRHDGRKYDVSPCALMWSEENYYLVGYDEGDGVVKNFRVDKVHDTEATDDARSNVKEVTAFNNADYSKKIFGMYGGREELITLEFREKLAGVVIDRFGTAPVFHKTDFGFKISLRVMISPTFFAWILGFGEDARILAPDNVRAELLERLEKTTKHYISED
jgi:predicted DNA-binding transcriptional regulator YafY